MTQKDHRPLDLEVFKKLSKEEIKEYGKSIPNGYTYDERGYKLTLKNSYGYWSEYTRDKNGEVLSFKNSSGYWYEYTRDEDGRILTYKNSYGVDIVYLFYGKKYNLGYDKTDMVYLAGCQELTYEECEKYYEENKDKFDDSHNFIQAIREHQKTLTESK